MFICEVDFLRLSFPNTFSVSILWLEYSVYFSKDVSKRRSFLCPNSDWENTSLFFSKGDLKIPRDAVGVIQILNEIHHFYFSLLLYNPVVNIGLNY